MCLYLPEALRGETKLIGATKAKGDGVRGVQTGKGFVVSK